MNTSQEHLLRRIPSCASILEHVALQPSITHYGFNTVKWQLKKLLDKLKQRLLMDETIEFNEIMLIEQLQQSLIRLFAPQSRSVINATGILLHTGLGRAPFSESVIEHLSIMNGYSLLQVELEGGKRSERECKIEQILCELTGCEAATVVNNNAAATMLILNTICKGKEAVISRGQMVEIGGSFRIPDVMSQSGAFLKEIGCTNQTHLRDYASAFQTGNVGAFLHVHTSNYRIRGFASTPSIIELCQLRDTLAPNLVIIDDLGSGALVELSKYGIENEPLIKHSIKAGVDLVCFSGDKLICGPQSGIICGKAKAIETIKKNPFMRMFRCCKMTLCALEMTLLSFISERYETQLPLYQALKTPLDELKKQALYVLENIEDVLALSGYKGEVIPMEGFLGSGTNPDSAIKSYGLRLEPKSSQKIKITCLAQRLRLLEIAIFCRIKENGIDMDFRTIQDSQMESLIGGIRQILENID